MTSRPTPGARVGSGHVRRVHLLRKVDEAHPLTNTNPDDPDERRMAEGVGVPWVLQVGGTDANGNSVGDMPAGAREAMVKDLGEWGEKVLDEGRNGCPRHATHSHHAPRHPHGHAPAPRATHLRRAPVPPAPHSALQCTTMQPCYVQALSSAQPLAPAP